MAISLIVSGGNDPVSTEQRLLGLVDKEIFRLHCIPRSTYLLLFITVECILLNWGTQASCSYTNTHLSAAVLYPILLFSKP